jgi:hypothetical protein
MAAIEISDEVRPYILMAIALGMFFTLWFLGAMFRREAVKRDLYERVCQPIHIWWTVWAWWSPYLDSIPFRVTYRDPFGAVHKARCYVTHRLFGPAFGPRIVRWVKDEIIRQPLSPEVWMDTEIIRSKLNQEDQRDS